VVESIAAVDEALDPNWDIDQLRIQLNTTTKDVSPIITAREPVKIRDESIF
jgi:hypothetical protein